MARPSVMRQGSAKGLAHELFPSFLRQRDRVEILDNWTRGIAEDDKGPYMPRESSKEYKQLAEVAPTPWLRLIITSLVQTISLEGIRVPGSAENIQSWTTWQRNGMDAKQNAIYRASMAHGAAFGLALPGKDPLTGENMPVLQTRSAKRMAAFYDDDEDQSGWAQYAISATPTYDQGTIDPDYPDGWAVTLYDDAAAYRFIATGADATDLTQWEFVDYLEHPAGVTPVVRYAASVDLDGRVTGDIEPLIPLARRIDQDTFDRLIVQRFGAWKVRYIAGLAKPDSEQEAVRQAMKLKVEDLLISGSADTKFGTLEETQLAGFIAARDADLRDLSATSQTPPHHMLGLSSNLQAESLAAAEAGLQRKSIEHKTSYGESHEMLLRLAAKIMGNEAEARAYDMQVRWRDMESRSLVQAAQALGTLATQVGVPQEMLWERIPNWTDTDTQRAKELVANSQFDDLANALLTQGQPKTPPGAPGAQPSASDAVTG